MTAISPLTDLQQLGLLHRISGIVSDPRFKTRFKRFSGLVEDTYEAFLSVPLVSGGEVIGVVRARLAQENQRLQGELETRKLVERAKGILQRNHTISEAEAYLRLRGESRRMRRPMKELAEAIILAHEMNRRRNG